MPTYDYDCADCGHEFEQFQSMSSASLEICPKCGGKVKRRIHGGAGLIFKGSGFYLTDYKKPSPGSGDGDKNAGDSAKKADGDTAKKDGSDKKDGGDKKGTDKKGTEEKSDSKVEKKEKTTE